MAGTDGKIVYKIPKFTSTFVYYNFTLFNGSGSGNFSKIYLSYYNWGTDFYYPTKNVYGTSVTVYYKSDSDYVYIGAQMPSGWNTFTLDYICITNYSGDLKAKLENYKTLGGVSRISVSSWSGYSTL